MSESERRQKEIATATATALPAAAAARLSGSPGSPRAKGPALVPPAAAATNSARVSTGNLLPLLWVVFLALVSTIIVGVVTISGEHDVWIWARVVFSLGVFVGLLIFACTLLFVVGKLRMEE